VQIKKVQMRRTTILDKEAIQRYRLEQKLQESMIASQIKAKEITYNTIHSKQKFWIRLIHFTNRLSLIYQFVSNIRTARNRDRKRYIHLSTSSC
jgi:hypothetical protein